MLEDQWWIRGMDQGWGYQLASDMHIVEVKAGFEKIYFNPYLQIFKSIHLNSQINILDTHVPQPICLFVLLKRISVIPELIQ